MIVVLRVVGSNPIGYPKNKNLLFTGGFFIFILFTIHQKALLKGIRGKKTHVFALFLLTLIIADKIKNDKADKLYDKP